MVDFATESRLLVVLPFVSLRLLSQVSGVVNPTKLHVHLLLSIGVAGQIFRLDRKLHFTNGLNCVRIDDRSKLCLTMTNLWRVGFTVVGVANRSSSPI